MRNIGCILKGGIELIYKHLYNGMMFSDDETRIEVYTKVAGLDYHIASIPYIRTELMAIAWRCMMSNNNVYCPIAHLSSTISAEIQSISPLNTILLNNMYVLQKVSSIYRLSIVQQKKSTLSPKIQLNVQDDLLDSIQLRQ